MGSRRSTDLATKDTAPFTGMVGLTVTLPLARIRSHNTTSFVVVVFERNAKVNANALMVLGPKAVYPLVHPHLRQCTSALIQ